MSFLYSVYTHLTPSCLRKVFDPAQRAFHECKNDLRRSREHRKRLKAFRGIPADRPLRVAFQVAHIGKWKSDSVLQAMLQDARFAPMIWIVPVNGTLALTTPENHRADTQAIRAYFANAGIPIADYATLADFPEATKPDLIFIHEAYDYIFSKDSYRGLKEALLCYVPYCFHNTTDAQEYNGVGNNCALFVFYENRYILNEARKVATNKGRNAVHTGNPIADRFMDPTAKTRPVWKPTDKEKKRVIWAPHWTITEDLCWFARGTFLQTAEAITELAEQYADSIQFSFKPHPHLYRILCNHPAWGKERTDAFYKHWAEGANTQLDTGEYTALIMQSDAMIHDSGSFRLEYLFADKPCMYLCDTQPKEDYNRMSTDTLTCYHLGHTKQEIETFLRNCVLGGQDPHAQKREMIRQHYLLPPGGKSAAQNIIDTLLAARRSVFRRLFF